jgi:site-specific DNA-cytosine methylase
MKLLNNQYPKRKRSMNELALFAGCGGGILAGHLLGWRTVAAVEIEDYPRRVLLQRQADGLLPRFPIWDDICTFDGKPWRGKVQVVSGGFPCQDISAAGKGAGLDGERSGLWGEMARIICEVRPDYAFIENSPMLTIRGLDRVLCDLAEMGFDAKWGVLGADDVGAKHKRDRIWIVAYPHNPNGGGNAGGSGAYKNAIKNGTLIPHSINPNLYEWLMGFPIGWTDLNALVTLKSPFVQQPLGES